MIQKTAYEKAKQRAKYLLLFLLIFYVLITAFLLLTDHLTDEFIMQWAQKHTHPALLWFTVMFAAMGKPEVIALKAIIPAALLWYFGYRREGIYLVATLLADIPNLLLKEIIDRERPTPELAKVLELANNPAFPSGHAVNFIVYYGFVLVMLPLVNGLPKLVRFALAVVLLLVIIIGPFSRIYAGMHWPTDIIGGGFFGVLFLSMLFYSYFNKAT